MTSRSYSGQPNVSSRAVASLTSGLSTLVSRGCVCFVGGLMAATIAILIAAEASRAHDLQYTITEGQAVVIRMHFADETPFSFEAYEIYREGADIPHQVGRSDESGRIAFLPDREGRWRLKAFSEDGHGLDITFETDAASAPKDAGAPFYERHMRIFVGLGFILGLFGLISLFYKGTKR